MGSGEYVGVLKKLDARQIVIDNLDMDGNPYSGFEPEEMDWEWSHPSVAAEALELGLEPGDRVLVEVEFEYYKAFRVEPFDWNPRKLHERLLRIEKHLGLES